MTSEALVGLWVCALVDQVQSEEGAQAFGEFEEFDHEPQNADETDFDATTLELRLDGSYRLQSMDWASSHGHWTLVDEVLELTEDVDASNEFERLVYARREDGRLVIAFELGAEAHDGRDILVLTFARSPSAAD